MTNGWFAENQELLRQGLTVCTALAICPPNRIAWLSIFLGALSFCSLAGQLARYGRSEDVAFIHATVELSGMLMLTLLLRWYGVGTRKAHRPDVNAPYPEETPRGRDAHSPLTDWRYAVGPVRPSDLTTLMDRGVGVSDRRSDERFQLGNVRGTLTALGTNLPEQECILVDLSAGGGRLLTRVPLPTGSLVKLETPKILLIGEVRFCESADGLQVIGVKFEAKIDRSRLRHLTSALLPMLGRARVDDSSARDSPERQRQSPHFSSTMTGVQSERQSDNARK